MRVPKRSPGTEAGRGRARAPRTALQSASGRMSFQAPIGAAVRDIVVDSLIVKVGGGRGSLCGSIVLCVHVCCA